MRDLVDFECDVTTYPYVTVIHHDREQRALVSDCEDPVCVSAEQNDWHLADNYFKCIARMRDIIEMYPQWSSLTRGQHWLCAVKE